MPKIVIQCPSCKGTGLYKGFAEKDGAAVVCHTCQGTGKTDFSYEEFTGRKEREGVNRVYDGTHGYGISDIDYTTAEGKVIRFSEGGCTYEEWKNGATPKPIKDLYCPYMHDNRGIGNEPLNRCKEGCKSFGLISNCTFYADKATCWREYEEKEIRK
jgi:hypothetical protein